MTNTTMRIRIPSMTDTTQALLTIVKPDSTVPEREEAADQVRAAHPDRPRAFLVTLLAAEALEARAAAERLQRRLAALEDGRRARHRAGSCESCAWQDGEMCLKFSEPHGRLGLCRSGYEPGRQRPGAERGVPLHAERAWTS